MATSMAPNQTGRNAGGFNNTLPPPPPTDGLPMGISLLNADDFGTVVAMKQSDRDKFTNEWTIALEIQKRQFEAWRTFYAGFKMNDDQECRYGTPDLTKLKREFNTYQQNGMKELKELNLRITKRTKKMTVPKNFGHVEIIPLREPRLCGQQFFGTVVNDFARKANFSAIYAKAYYIQLARDRWMADPSNFDTEADGKFRNELATINSLLKGYLTKEEIALGHAYIEIPTPGDRVELREQSWQPRELEMVKEMEEDQSGTESETSETQDTPLSPEVEAIMSSIGGHEGPLQRYLMARHHMKKAPAGSQEQTELETTVKTIDGEITNIVQLARSKADEQNKLAAADEQMKIVLPDVNEISTFAENIGHASELYKQIREQPDNIEAKEKYKLIRDSVKEWILQRNYPLSFVDALAPIAPGMSELSPQNQLLMNQMLEVIGGPEGNLHRYLEALASGKTDEGADKAVSDFREKLRMDQSCTPLLNLLEGSELELMVQGVRDLLKLEKQCRMNTSDTTARKHLEARNKELQRRYIDYPALMQAVIGNIYSSRNYLKPLDERLDGDPLPNLEFERRVLAILKEVHGKNGVLQKLVHSTASGEVDDAAKNTVYEVFERVSRLCNDNNVPSTTVLPNQEYLAGMVATVTGLLQLQQDCIENPRKGSTLLAFSRAVADASIVYRGNDLYHDAVIGNLDNWEPLDEVETPKKKTRTKDKKSKKPGRRRSEYAEDGMLVVEAPSAEIEDEQAVATAVKPGVVQRIIDDKIVMMRIMGERNVGGTWGKDKLRGGQLLLKFVLLNPKYPAWKFLPKSEFKGAWQECMNMPEGAPKFPFGKKEELEGILWSQVSICGVPSVERDEEDVFCRRAHTAFILKFQGRAEIKGYWQSDVRNRWGNQIEVEAVKYRRLSGETAPKAPWAWSATKRLLRTVETDRAREGKVPLKELSSYQHGKIRKRAMMDAEERGGQFYEEEEIEDGDDLSFVVNDNESVSINEDEDTEDEDEDAALAAEREELMKKLARLEKKEKKRKGK